MPLTTPQSAREVASRCLKEACRDIRREWTHREHLKREHRADEMQARLWGVIHGWEMAPAPAAIRR